LVTVLELLMISPILLSST